jgi:hypothetical protein
MPTLKNRLDKLDGRTTALPRVITVEAADDLNNEQVNAILADHAIIPARADLIVLMEDASDMTARVAVNSIVQVRVGAAQQSEKMA